MKLELGDVTVEVARHEALTRQFRCATLRVTQGIFVSARLRRWYASSSPEGSTEAA